MQPVEGDFATAEFLSHEPHQIISVTDPEPVTSLGHLLEFAAIDTPNIACPVHLTPPRKPESTLYIGLFARFHVGTSFKALNAQVHVYAILGTSQRKSAVTTVPQQGGMTNGRVVDRS